MFLFSIYFFVPSFVASFVDVCFALTASDKVYDKARDKA
jgi:hypothetical protein